MYGQLGDDSFEDRLTPVQVVIPDGQRAIDVTGGRLHTMALTGKSQDSVYGFDLTETRQPLALYMGLEQARSVG